ncbi:class I SAM-dependent methyltransferase [Actinophytocola sp.]|uniref:class I SAM-dependent methyltransferase n=1 Tax=Actinophytocola sp. TaxID=1872138 RepID=UPI002D7F6451|nr:class I SAM-dependent methyltransferase [Actinophytocola sp.]HET9139850.1 class I SAM-dependent methyltransferase [Actinophytocola sp.]
MEKAGAAPVDATGFDAAWKLADDIPGWLTRDQGRSLWDAACRLGPGATIVEIGSHQGRSTVVLGLAARTVGAHVVAVDPFVEWRGGMTIRERFEANIAAAGLGDVVELVIGYSTKLRPGWSRPIDLLYIDGKHDYWTYSDDLRWSAHMAPGAEILVHDCYSSVGVTLGTLAKVLPASRYTYLDRAGSLARFVLRRPRVADRLRILRELPWFTRNVIIKGLLYLRLRPLTRHFGHDSPYAPY